MNWEERIDNYVQETGFPRSIATLPNGDAFGIFRGGNDYRVTSGFYGGYPATYLRRIKALFPEKKKILHLFSGRVDLYAFPGDTVDIDPSLHPTYLDDAQTLTKVPLEDYDLVLADPPFSVEDCEHYHCTMIKRNTVMRALGERLPRGAHVVWLDQVLPMYRKDQFYREAEIGMTKSTNHRYRVVVVFRKR